MSDADTYDATMESAVVPPKSELRDTLVFLLKLAVIVFVFRAFAFSSFNIPSESMLPRLKVGDFLFVSKWNYGYSRHSLPFSLPLIPGRILPATPARGDVVVFKAPPTNNQDYIKRVIGIPGDTIQLRGGVVILNGVPVTRTPVDDFVIPISPNYRCTAEYRSQDTTGRPACRYRQYREMLPGGRSYLVLDRGQTVADDTELFTVPAGHVFMMGDNRDDSQDSRFVQAEGQGIGYVPMENLEGKAVITFFSTDGSAVIYKPWTWFSAVRWDRIGEGF